MERNKVIKKVFGIVLTFAAYIISVIVLGGMMWFLWKLLPCDYITDVDREKYSETTIAKYSNIL